MKWPRKKPLPRRADPLTIAVLEYELLGIEPQPGTAAAFAIGLRQAVSGTATAYVDFPPSMPRREVAEWAAAYARQSGNPRLAMTGDTRVEIYKPPADSHDPTEETT